jgi:NAD(P)-dependent dehydrogenase (short-subunit alcohol dehydrogenase family)
MSVKTIFDVEGKTVLITGAGRGIGRALADRFVAAGMKLAIADIEDGPLEAAARELKAAGAEVLSCRVDVGNGAAMDDFARKVLDTFGAVHVVCNNAGVGSGGRMWELGQAEWEFAMGPNLWGVIHGVRVFCPHLVEQDEGHIVNTASMAGLINVSGLGAYNVTKGAVVSLSETLYADLEAVGSNVSASVLCPGFVNTKIWDADRHRTGDQANAERQGTPEEREMAEKMIRSVMEQAKPAAEVADEVHDAILEKRFYVLTHASAKTEFEARAQRLLNDENPGQPTDGPMTFSR